MRESTANHSQSAVSWLEPTSYFFRLLFPDLAELVRVGVLVREVAIRRALDRLGRWAERILKQRSGSERIVTPLDVVSESVIRIETRDVLLKYSRNRGRVDSLVYGTMWNVAQELTRRHRKARGGEELLSLVDAEPGPDGIANRDEELVRLQKAFARLTTKERDSLRRKYGNLFGGVADLNQKSACDYARRSRALSRLRTFLTES